MPRCSQLHSKYLKEMFDKHMNNIKEDFDQSKISVVVDESPGITGVPTVNTLTRYYSPSRKEKHALLVNVVQVNVCNSLTLTNVVMDTLKKVRKALRYVIALSSSPAEYGRKMMKDVSKSELMGTVHVEL